MLDILFDSARPGDPRSQNSYLCTNPVEIITCINGQVFIDDMAVQGDAFSILRNRLDHYRTTIDQSEKTLFNAGAAGYFGFDLGRLYEPWGDSTRNDMHLPDMVVGIYPYGHVKHNPTIPDNCQASYDITLTAEQSDVTHQELIQRVIDYIYEGDIFQTCLARRFSAKRPDDFNSYDHYLHLRKSNPAPFGGYLKYKDFSLSCTSPERFLSVCNGYVETRPIKGTTPDTQTPETLKKNTKECAENAMIVDLLRNDMARNCTDDSIIVKHLNQIETYEGLHHLVSSVTGKLKQDTDNIQLFKDCFPGGSISGAPKIRACQIIDELELTRRGPYCGSLAWFDFNGNMDSNILIRTLITTQSHLYLHSGGGIVAQSDPEKEVAETWLKAAPILGSLRP